MIGLIDKNIFKVLTLFSISPGSGFTREEIKNKTGLSNASLNKSINSIINLHFLIRKGKLFLLDFKNSSLDHIIKQVHEAYNKLKNLPLSIYLSITDILYVLIEEKIDGEVYLFGSYSKLTFNDNSDIDIAIISDKINKKTIALRISKIERRIGKNIELHYFSHSFHSSKKDPLVKEILQHGVKLI